MQPGINKSICKIFVIVLLLLSIPTPAKTQEQSLWNDLGLYGGQINSVAVDPEDSSLIYAGSWGGDGLFRSTDSGKTWFSIPENNTSWFRNLEINSISIDPNNPLTVWVANGNFVDVSYDSGEAWKTFFFASEENRFCYTVAVDPHDKSGNTVYVGTGGPDYTNEFGEIFITTDGGEYWEKMNFITADNVWNNFWHISFNPNKPGEVWAANRKSHLSPDGYIYMTNDYGKNWWYWTHAWWTDNELYPFGYLDEVLVHPADPLKIFASDEYGLLVKTDGPGLETGWFWAGFGKSCRSICIPAADPDTVYAGLINEVAKSMDGGATWENFPEAPGEFLSMNADPFNADTLYAGSLNSGVFKTLDGAQSWNSINAGIKANSIFSTDFSPVNSSGILCGTLSGVYLENNNSWTLLNNSKANSVRFHPENETTVYAGFSWKIGKSTDSGSTWSYLYTPEQYESNKISSISLFQETSSENIIFAAVSYDSGDKGEILKIHDKEKSFSDSSFKSVFVSSVRINTVQTDPENSKVVFAGTGNFFAPVAPGGLYFSTDKGETWALTDVQDVVVNSISISPENPEIIFAGCGGSNAVYSGIYKSIDRGRTWKEKTKGLPPSFAVSDIQVDRYNDNIVYAALYKGFDEEYRNLGGTYITLDGGDYWTQIGLSDYRLYDINSSGFISGDNTDELQTDRKSGVSFPAINNIIAGTASGLYRASTTGSGIITGIISSQDTSSVVDGAIVSSYSGSNCLSVEGYYMLMVPAGIHTLQVQASGYEQTSVPAITVSAGQSTTQNIVMMPVPEDNSTSCLASLILDKPSDKNNISLLRKFRDAVLNRTATGRHLTEIYYRTGRDVWSVLEKNPELNKRCLKLLTKSFPVIKAFLNKNQTDLPSSLLNELSCFLFELEQLSPPEIKKQVNDLRKSMKNLNFIKL